MERGDTLILTSLEFPDLVRLFNDTSISMPITDAVVPRLLDHDILRIRMRSRLNEVFSEDLPIELLLKVLYAKRAWMYGIMCFEEKPGVKSIRRMEEIIVPERLVLRSPFDYFKEGEFRHFSAQIDEMDVIWPELVPFLQEG